VLRFSNILVSLAEPTTSRSLDALPPSTFQHEHKHTKKLVMGKSTAGEEGMGPVDKGRYRYAKGDYTGALAAFTEVSTPILPLFQSKIAAV
jgi:hypothetical protein